MAYVDVYFKVIAPTIMLFSLLREIVWINQP